VGLVQGTPQEEKIFSGRDLKEHIRSETRQFIEAHGGSSFREVNKE